MVTNYVHKKDGPERLRTFSKRLPWDVEFTRDIRAWDVEFTLNMRAWDVEFTPKTRAFWHMGGMGGLRKFQPSWFAAFEFPGYRSLTALGASRLVE